MNLSWRIFTAFKIPVRLHISMLIIPFMAYRWVNGTELFDMILATGLTVLLFGSVLLHEFGHALIGRRYGVHTADIVLTPLGGMARMLNIPTNPQQEIAISIAGPLVSFAIAIFAFSIKIFLESVSIVSAVTQLTYSISTLLFELNLMLGLFNLIPALPMDGGRILRGLLALKFNHLKATQISSSVGKGFAILGFLAGIYLSSWSMALISLFIFMSAGKELKMAAMREAQKQTRNGVSNNPFAGVTGNFNMHTNINSNGFRQNYTFKDFQWQNPQKKSEYKQDEIQHPNHDLNAKVVIIEGGKAKIISRKDPSD